MKKTSAGSLLAPLRVRDFRLLFGGQLISTIGDAFYAVALPWLVLTNGGGAQELGIILSAYGIPPWSPYLPTSPLEGCWR